MAPTRLRGRMLAAVFMCQPLGQLLATLVPLIAVYAARGSLPNNTADCDYDCKQTLDVIWRLILGLGAIPAAASLWFRLTIIERCVARAQTILSVNMLIGLIAARDTLSTS
jgi:PHS family inorganic phosphate transporter-like MFS transporter